MKKLLIISSILCCSLQSIACDICGSGAGGGYMGLLPGFRKRFISCRYLQNGTVSHLGANGASTYLTSYETFRIAEAWGAFNIGTKFRVAAFVPLNSMERNNGSGHFTKSGLGDISVIGYYQLFNSQRGEEERKGLVQSAWIGAGVKLPTGKYNPAEKNITASQQNSFQLGTGSTDFSVHGMYDIRLKDAGINVNTSYKLNTANTYGYKYGNKFTLNMLGYYKIRLSKSISIAPNTGVLYEQSAKDEKVKGISVWETGGHSLMGTAGLEVALGRIGLGANYQTPLQQQLGEGKIKARDRGMVYVSFSF